MMIFTSVYGVVDGLFVSNFVGKTPFAAIRSEEHTSELQSRHNISYAVFCLKKKKAYCPSQERLLTE